MFKIFFSLSLLFTCACTNRTDEIKPQQNSSNQWQYLTLELNDTVIKLIRTVDSFEVEAPKGGVIKYQISKPEKDSLFVHANELLDFRGHSKWFCTDYVGKLKVRIRYNAQVLKEVSFSSICNWRDLNPNTQRIDDLLKKTSISK